MLRLPSFTYRQPRTLAEAVSMKADAGPDGMYVAGGTDLYPNMKRRHQEPRTVISLDRKSTRLNSSHGYISYAVFCLKKKKKHPGTTPDVHHTLNRSTGTNPNPRDSFRDTTKISRPCNFPASTAMSTSIALAAAPAP